MNVVPHLFPVNILGVSNNRVRNFYIYGILNYISMFIIYCGRKVKPSNSEIPSTEEKCDRRRKIPQHRRFVLRFVHSKTNC